jgi:hypothetical protein
MRTTITMDDSLLRELSDACGEKAMSKAVTIAVKEYLRRNKLKKLSSMLGKVEFDVESSGSADALDLERANSLTGQAGRDE